MQPCDRFVLIVEWNAVNTETVQVRQVIQLVQTLPRAQVIPGKVQTGEVRQ